MRDEIILQIKNSGTTDENLIMESYKSYLIKRGIAKQQIEKLIHNKDTIQKMKHRIALADMEIEDSEIEEIIQMIISEKPLTRQISLTRNHIKNVGAIKLAHLIQSLENLSVLDLQSNEIGKEGERVLLELKAKRPKLILALGDNKINEEEKDTQKIKP